MTDTTEFLKAHTDLSIVIITRDEAKNIARAIESVLHSIEHIPQTEILLVDSASSDETIEIAKRYPINIVRLPSNWFLSVSAGRHIGMHYTRGEFVLHMDGDMELDSNWIDRSVSYLLEHPDVGAVGGYWRNIYEINGQIVGEEDEYRDSQGRILEAPYVGGAALYRRQAILKMGGFQPFIRGEEGVYLSMGIRFSGYKVVMLPYLMSQHYCIPRQSLAGGLRKLRLGFMQGYGQVLRSYWGTKLFWIYIRERLTYPIFYFLGLFVTLICFFLTLFTKNLIYLGSWMFLLSLTILGLVIKKRSLSKTWTSFLNQTWIAYSTVRGFLLPLRSSSEYPTDAEIIQVNYNHGGLCLTKSSSENNMQFHTINTLLNQRLN